MCASVGQCWNVRIQIKLSISVEKTQQLPACHVSLIACLSRETREHFRCLSLSKYTRQEVTQGPDHFSMCILFSQTNERTTLIQQPKRGNILLVNKTMRQFQSKRRCWSANFRLKIKVSFSATEGSFLTCNLQLGTIYHHRFRDL